MREKTFGGRRGPSRDGSEGDRPEARTPNAPAAGTADHAADVAAENALGVVQKVEFGLLDPAAGTKRPDIVVLRVRSPGRTAYLVVATAGVAQEGGGVRLFADRPLRGGAGGEIIPVSEKLRYRKRLEGALLVAVKGRAALLVRGDDVYVLEVSGTPARIVLRDATDDERAARWRTDDDGTAGLGDAAMGAAGGPAVEAVGTEPGFDRAALQARALEAKRARVAAGLARAKKTLERRKAAVLGDLERIASADALAVHAQSFVAEAGRAKRGARELSVTDWSTGEARTITLTLDPAKSAREQVDAMFKRARRLKHGGVIARARLDATAQALALLDALAEEAGAATSDAALEALIARARAAAPRDFALVSPQTVVARGGGKDARPLPPFRLFRPARRSADGSAHGGARILVGRGGAHNDALTFHVAKPHDLWLHAKERAGAHVIVPLEKGRVCPPDLLVEAAHLAAHFSDARDEAVVDVQYTPRRYLRKPRGSAPGFVVVDREKVLVLRVDRALLTDLLAREER
jgi:hypothetical protein